MHNVSSYLSLRPWHVSIIRRKTFKFAAINKDITLGGLDPDLHNSNSNGNLTKKLDHFTHTMF